MQYIHTSMPLDSMVRHVLGLIRHINHIRYILVPEIPQHILAIMKLK